MRSSIWSRTSSGHMDRSLSPVRRSALSPLGLAALGWVFVLLMLLVQDAVLRDQLAPDSVLSEVLATVVPPMTICLALMATGWAVVRFIRGQRAESDLLAIMVAAPIIGLWALALQKWWAVA